MMKSIWQVLGVLMLPAALSAQPVSHALVASPADLPSTRRAFITAADTVHVLAVMVQFQEDKRRADDRATAVSIPRMSPRPMFRSTRRRVTGRISSST